jgi:ornithine carbamoyltransferase
MKKDLVSLADLTSADLQSYLDEAVALKKLQKAGQARPLLAGKTLGMIFQKPSLRTRVSFEVGMLQLGGHALYLSPNEIQLGVRESVPDVARVMSRYCDGIMARVFAHADVLALAHNASVPVINGLSDFSHPCQGLADFLTIYEHKGPLAGLKLAFVGDANNVYHSLLFAAAKLGTHIVCASPAGYGPSTTVLDLARPWAAASGSQVTATIDPFDAVRDADVIYTDVWTSMGQEAEAEKRRVAMRPFQVNAALVAAAKKDVIVMHCLPAHRGEEITDDVVDGRHSVVFDQAENRMHAQKAVLARLMA